MRLITNYWFDVCLTKFAITIVSNIAGFLGVPRVNCSPRGGCLVSKSEQWPWIKKLHTKTFMYSYCLQLIWGVLWLANSKIIDYGSCLSHNGRMYLEKRECTPGDCLVLAGDGFEHLRISLGIFSLLFNIWNSVILVVWNDQKLSESSKNDR